MTKKASSETGPQLCFIFQNILSPCVSLQYCVSKRRSFKHCCFFEAKFSLSFDPNVCQSFSKELLSVTGAREDETIVLRDTLLQHHCFKVSQPPFHCITNDTNQCHCDTIAFISDFTWVQQLLDNLNVNKEKYDPEMSSVSQSTVLIIL